MSQQYLQRDSSAHRLSRSDSHRYGRVTDSGSLSAPPYGGAESLAPSAPPWAIKLVNNLAAQDWLITGYFAVILMALAFGTGPGRAESMLRVQGDLAVLWVGLVLTRGEIIKPGPFASLVYRLTIFGLVALSYFQLREILPAVSSRALDAQIFELDMRLFGFEPALAWDKYVNPQTTEWFSFFYFGYFFVLAAHLFPFLLVVRDRDLLARFSLGIYIVFCTAHTLYMAVPGYGPYQFLASEFQNELSGGVFWGLVRSAVDAGGAQKDIFPSLHTAAPTFFALFSFRNRHITPFRYTWPIVTFICSQIIIATMFLRWHYLIDIVAGLALATAAVFVSERVAGWEKERRRKLGAQDVFEPLLPDEPR
jgi:hypothetical protein